MQGRNTDSVRLTHLPTGKTAVQFADMLHVRPRGAWRIRCETLARRKLASELCRPSEPPHEVRKYDLCPPLKIAPNIRQGKLWLASGWDEVRAVLDGGLELLWRGDL